MSLVGGTPTTPQERFRMPAMSRQERMQLKQPSYESSIMIVRTILVVWRRHTRRTYMRRLGMPWILVELLETPYAMPKTQVAQRTSSASRLPLRKVKVSFDIAH